MSNPQHPYSNPYSSPAGLPGQYSPKPVGGGALDTWRPMYDVIGWIKFLAWIYIILGVLYALTICGLVIAWLPIWMGISLKNGAEALENGYRSQNPRQVHQAAENFSLVIKIVGICTAIGMALNVLYIIFLIFAIAAGGLF